MASSIETTVGPVLFGPDITSKIIIYLRTHGLLSRSCNCIRYSELYYILNWIVPHAQAVNTDEFLITCICLVYRCGIAMVETVKASAGSDGVCWSCPICKTTRSIRRDRFFSKSKMRLYSWILALWWWAREYPVGMMAEEAGIGEDSACNIYQWLREVCSTTLIQTPIILGGQGIIVEIDESQFKHKPKVFSIIIVFHP